MRKIAHALGDLNESVVFVGGAVVCLYIDDPAAHDVRPTKDIDISMEIAGLTELEGIREALKERGFIQSHEDDVICRFRFDDIKVDIMATKAVGWAPSNRWFAPGFGHLISFNVDGIMVNCLPLPYFLASKFTAFYDRGSKDPRTSHDFEDIVYLLNHTTDLKKQVEQAETTVKAYLKDCFADIMSDRVKQEAIMANLYFEIQEIRFQKLMRTLNEIVVE